MRNIKKRSLLSTLAARTTALVSVALVLMVTAALACACIMSERLGSSLRQRVGFTAVMRADAPAGAADSLRSRLQSAPWCAGTHTVTPEEVLSRWQQATGDDDVVAALGANPFTAECEVRVRPTFATTEALRPILAEVAKMPGVERVRMQAAMIDRINAILSTLMLWGAVIAAALLAVSIALINNMVKLTVYGRRFIINTMLLVGATAAYVRRPFVLSSMALGAVAAAVACVALGAGVWWLYSAEPQAHLLLPLWSAVAVGAGVTLAGVAICGLSAVSAVNRCLRLDRDALFSM